MSVATALRTPVTVSRTSPAHADRAPVGRTAVVAILLMLALLASLIAAVVIGPADISPVEVARSVWAHLTGADAAASRIRDAIIWEGRVPRALTAAAVGGGLALCGAVMQALTRNPLADPYLLGLSSGASTGAVIVIVLGASLALDRKSVV